MDVWSAWLKKPGSPGWQRMCLGTEAECVEALRPFRGRPYCGVAIVGPGGITPDREDTARRREERRWYREREYGKP